jgi:hypothetical protein
VRHLFANASLIYRTFGINNSIYDGGGKWWTIPKCFLGMEESRVAESLMEAILCIQYQRQSTVQHTV